MSMTTIPPSGNAVSFTASAWSKELQATIKGMVAKNCTDAEFATLCHLGQKYDLDPLAKEIWAIKRPGSTEPALIFASRDGYLKAAQRDGAFKGLAAGVVREGDHFAFDGARGLVEHTFGAKRGKILGAWAIAHHATRMPVACFIDFDEYAKAGGPVWSKFPSAMAQKVAEVFVLKRQFGIHGLVTQEEMAVESGNYDDGPTVEATLVRANPRPATGAQLRAMFATATDLGLTENDIKAVMWGNDLGLTNDPAKPVSTKLLTVAEASHMIDNLLPEAARGLVVDAETEGTITHE